VGVRFLAAVIATAGVVASGFPLLAASPSPGSSPASRVSLIGCIGTIGKDVSDHAEVAFVLTDAVPSADHRRGRAGTNSSKASTPVGSAPATIGAAGARTYTAKGSTPVSVGTPALVSSGFAGTTTSKGSTPLPRRSSRATYELDMDRAALERDAGHTVEVVGTLQNAARLKADSVKMLAPTCSY
jgi:hypothetical protein